MSTRARLASRRERGTTLFVALIVLVAMSLAGIALMRSVDTNVLIAGNLAFRQGATAGGDWGVEDARAWITANAASLNNDKPAGATFYYATWQESLDLIGNNPDPTVENFDWNTTDASKFPADLGFDQAGNRVQYLIHRLCDKEGAPNAVQCVKSSVSAATSSPDQTKRIGPVDSGPVTIGTVIFYRITVRITGPRNTVSFLQAVLN
jgi:type IV pilus assembly protein PilX